MKLIREFADKLQKLVLRVWARLRKRFLLMLKLLLLLFLTGGVLIPLLYFVPGLGFGTYINEKGEIVPMKTLWEWLELWIAPAFLAAGGLWLSSTIQKNERERAEKRGDLDREIADDRLKEQTLQTYLDHMSNLLLDGHFDSADKSMKAAIVARAWTLTAVRLLNRERKSAVLQFLYESGLIWGQSATISLDGADFTLSYLQSVNLSDAHLEGINLGGANLAFSNLEGAKFQNAQCAQSNFSGAQLEEANLLGAFLYETNFRRAHLEKANLREAKLIGADLYQAYLEGANLFAAHLEGANLEGASVSQEQLSMAFLDEETVLPDGSHYKPIVPANP